MTAQRRGVFQVTLLRRLLERDNVENAEPVGYAGIG
jgi:hypothetical protein